MLYIDIDIGMDNDIDIGIGNDIDTDTNMVILRLVLMWMLTNR